MATCNNDNQIILQVFLENYLREQAFDTTMVSAWEKIKKIGELASNISFRLHPYSTLFYPNMKYTSPYTNCLGSAEGILHHGFSVSEEFIKCLIEKCIPIFFTEDGFIGSIVRPVMYENERIMRTMCSRTLDFRGTHFDISKPSDLETILNSEEKLSNDELIRAQKAIQLIVSNKISKYNNQPLTFESPGDPQREKILVLDQAYADLSVIKSGADESTFEKMLLDAIAENPECDILVKVHPDMLQNPNRGGGKDNVFGYYTNFNFSKYDNVYLVGEFVNPYALFEKCRKVYVCSSQMGFEALLYGLDVVIYGTPFYAGWGLGECRSTNHGLRRRVKLRSIEEIFHYAYIWYSRYIDPIDLEMCPIEKVVTRLVELRDLYLNLEEGNKKTKELVLPLRISVAFATDKSFVYPTIVSILSLLVNSKPTEKYDIYILHTTDVTDEDHNLIKKYILTFDNVKLFFISTQNVLSNCYESRHLSIVAYARLLLPKLLPELDKIIYSDSDVIFLRGLSDAWNLTIGGHSLAAVLDGVMNLKTPFHNVIISKRKKFGLEKYFYNHRYEFYCSGFLIMNLKQLRNEDFVTRALELSTLSFDYHDQDILNILCFGKIFPLSTGYVMIPRLLADGFYRKSVNEGIIPKQYYIDATTNPSIIHYAGVKPWQDDTIHGAEWWWDFVKNYHELYSYFKTSLMLNKLLQAEQKNISKSLSSSTDQPQPGKKEVIHADTSKKIQKIEPLVFRSYLIKKGAYVSFKFDKQIAFHFGTKLMLLFGASGYSKINVVGREMYYSWICDEVMSYELTNPQKISEYRESVLTRVFILLEKHLDITAFGVYQNNKSIQTTCRKISTEVVSLDFFVCPSLPVVITNPNYRNPINNSKDDRRLYWKFLGVQSGEDSLSDMSDSNTLQKN